MKRLFVTTVAALAVLLSGCATTIRSNVTTFHQWPAQIEDKSYAMEAPAPQDDTLELRSYQGLVRAQLARLGFREAEAKPALLVSMRFMTTEIPVQVVQPAFSPFFQPSLRFNYLRPHRRGMWAGGWYSPFYDPFWGPYGYETQIESRYRRQLQVAIRSAADGRRLFDVTVQNVSSEMSTPALMPALVQSAFEGFPGPSGVARQIELTQVNK